MKKLVLILGVLLVTMCGCGKSEDSGTTAGVTTEVVTTVSEATTEAATEAEATDTTEAEAVNDASTKAETTSPQGTRFEMVRGGSFLVPAGFDNVTQSSYPLQYVNEWNNSGLDMHITVTDAMKADIPVSLDDEYNQLIGSFKDQASVPLKVKDSNSYTVSGTDANGIITYQKVRVFNDRYVCMNITYPSANSGSCNKIVEDFVANFTYE